SSLDKANTHYMRLQLSVVDVPPYVLMVSTVTSPYPCSTETDILCHTYAGSLSTGQGTRFVIAATEHLHRRIATLSARIRLLEDALISLQASHPLLHPDLVARENDDLGMMDEKIKVDKGNKEKKGDVIDALGTLSISDHGVSRFFGPTGGIE
ncbi:hypothetical protein C0989_011336, partial [Termitomyces sp. Mn162]